MKGRRANGEGSFTQLANGSYKFRTLYTPENEREPRRLTVTAKSRPECMKKMRKKIKEIELLSKPIRADFTVEELCRAHLKQHMEQKGRLKTTSADRRESTINNQISPYPIAKLQCLYVQPYDIQSHIERLISEDRLAVSSIEKAFHVISGSYRWAVSIGFIPVNPCDAVKEAIEDRFHHLSEREADDRDVVVLSEEECIRLQMEAMLQKEDGTFVHAIGPYVMFLLETGMRIGELCALRWENVSWNQDTVVVSIVETRHHVKERDTEGGGYVVKEGKVKNMHSRHIVLNEEAAALLRDIYWRARDNSPEAYVMVNRRYNPTNPSNAGAVINRLYRAAGLSKTISGAHILRRTFATNAFRKGANIKMIASYIGDLESTASKYYISAQENLRVGDRVMNVIQFPNMDMQ